MSDDVDSLIRGLLAEPRPLDDLTSRLPPSSGLYAWWTAPRILPELVGPTHPRDDGLRLLYVGIATNLRQRILRNHLRRSGSSTLRQTLAGLLLDNESYRTRWTSRVVLLDEYEERLTRWMGTNLTVSWIEHPTPRREEAALIGMLGPPLNLEHAGGPARELVRAARRRYYASGGPRPSDVR